MGGARATVAPPALDSSVSTLACGEASCRRRSASPGRSFSCHSPGGLGSRPQTRTRSPQARGRARAAGAGDYSTRLGLGPSQTLSPFD